MTRDDFVDVLMKRLKNQTDTSLRDDIIKEIVYVQENILEQDVFKPWFLINPDFSLTATATNVIVALPSDFLGFWDLVPVYRYDSTKDDPYLEMYRDDWGLITTEYNYSGPPTHWDLSGSSILVRPIPDDTYDLRLFYYKTDVALAGTYGDANNVENQWLNWAVDWMMGEVGAIMAGQYLAMKDYIISRFEAQALKGRDRLMKLNVAMEEALKERIMGG